MAASAARFLLLAVLAAVIPGAAALAGAGDSPTNLEAENRAVLARLVDYAQFLANGQFTIAGLFDTLAAQGPLKYGLHEPYAKAVAKIQFWETTVVEALVWIGDDCQSR